MDVTITEYIYMHFDNSFKIMCYDKKTPYGKQQYLIFRKIFEKLLEKTWSTKNANI